MADDILMLTSGYDRHKTTIKRPYRRMTRDEVLTLQSGHRVVILTAFNTVRDVKVNGRVRTWKRNPNRVEIPMKYGLRETFTLSMVDALRYLVVPVTPLDPAPEGWDGTQPLT